MRSYFSTSKVAIVDGRSFDDRDVRTARQVVIVNETLASHFWPNQSAIGRSLVVGRERVEVVGVARDGKYLFCLGNDSRNDVQADVAKTARSGDAAGEEQP